MFWVVMAVTLGVSTAATAAALVFLSSREDRELATFISICIAGLGVCSMVGLTISQFHAGDTSGDGYSVGTVVNVGRVGFWWKNPAMYLLHAGEMKAEIFAVDDPLLEQAKHYADTGERVRVHYTSSMICGAWHRADCDVVDAIDLDIAKATPTTEKTSP